MSNAISLLPTAPELQTAPLFAPTPRAGKRVLEFFTGQIRNDHTRRAYLNAMKRFSEWCDRRGVGQLADVQPIHVAAFVKELGQEVSPPTVKQNLAALRMLFDWLVTGHVIDTNPAHSVRGPRHVVKKGKTPVLSAEETRTLLDDIEIVRTVRRDDGTEVEEPNVVGLRDRALIGLMVYTFARVGAAVGMKVEDCYTQGRRLWVRLHEKGGKRHEMPTHHNLEAFLEQYIHAAGIADQRKSPLFRTTNRRTGKLTDNPMVQTDVYRMIRRRAEKAGIKTEIGCHTFRATGITVYLKNGGKLEVAQQMAAHESSRTTGLYDRRDDEITQDEVARIAI